MAAESEWSCLICCDDQESTAYMSPCLHCVCLGCALRWAWQKPTCPVCPLAVTTIMFSIWSEDDYLTFDILGHAEPPTEDPQNEQGAVGQVAGPRLGGCPPEVWAGFFRSHPDNIRLLLQWLQQELGQIFEGQWWEANVAEGVVVSHLCLWGLDERVLVQQLHNCLREDTRPFVHRLIPAAVRLCGGDIRRHLGQQEPHASQEEDQVPAAADTSATEQENKCVNNFNGVCKTG